jgi:hypothetical protein
MRAVGAMPTELIRWQSAATASRFMVGFGFPFIEWFWF